MSEGGGLAIETSPSSLPKRGIGAKILLGLLKAFKMCLLLVIFEIFRITAISANTCLPLKGWALVVAGENIWIGFHEHAVETLTEELFIPDGCRFDVALAQHDGRCQLPCKILRHRASLILQARAHHGLRQYADALDLLENYTIPLLQQDCSSNSDLTLDRPTSRIARRFNATWGTKEQLENYYHIISATIHRDLGSVKEAKIHAENLLMWWGYPFELFHLDQNKNRFPELIEFERNQNKRELFTTILKKGLESIEFGDAQTRAEADNDPSYCYQKYTLRWHVDGVLYVFCILYTLKWVLPRHWFWKGTLPIALWILGERLSSFRARLHTSKVYSMYMGLFFYFPLNNDVIAGANRLECVRREILIHAHYEGAYFPDSTINTVAGFGNFLGFDAGDFEKSDRMFLLLYELLQVEGPSRDIVDMMKNQVENAPLQARIFHKLFHDEHDQDVFEKSWKETLAKRKKPYPEDILIAANKSTDTAPSDTAPSDDDYELEDISEL